MTTTKPARGLITTDDLDMAQISLWLADNQLPDGNTFLQQGSVGAGLIQTEVWTAVPYLTGWADFGSGFQVGQFAVDVAGFVHLRGLTAHSAAYTFPAAVCTLPPGARPAAEEAFTCAMGDFSTGQVTARVDVRPDGVVYVQNAVPAPSMTNLSYLTLSGITFKAGN